MASTRPLGLFVTRPIGQMAERLAPLLDLAALADIEDSESFLQGESGRIRFLFVNSGQMVPRTLIERLPNLRLIAILGAGYDMVDVAHAQARGVAVTTGRGVNRDDVADMALGLVIATVRGIAAGDRLIRDGGWTRPLPCAQSRSLCDLRYGVLGMGEIGATVAQRLSVFGQPVRWWGPRPKPVPWERTDSLLDLARLSDVLVVACRVDESSRRIVDAGVLDALGPRGFLVNIARGEAVDEAALLSALREGRIAGAGLDVFAPEPLDPGLWADLDNVVMTPHIAGWADRGMRVAEETLVENVRRSLNGEPLLTPLPPMTQSRDNMQ